MIIYSLKDVRNGSRSVRARALERTSHQLAKKRALEQKKSRTDSSSKIGPRISPRIGMVGESNKLR